MKLLDRFPQTNISFVFAIVPVAFFSGNAIAKIHQNTDLKRHLTQDGEYSVTRSLPTTMRGNPQFGGSHTYFEAGNSPANPGNGTKIKDTNLVTLAHNQTQARMIEKLDTDAKGAASSAYGDRSTIKADSALLPPPCGPSDLSAGEVAELVVEAARKLEIDENLALAIAFVESRFDRQRNSPKGARGAMQLMPETASRFGVSDVCDPHANIVGGTRYLRVLHEEFGNPLLIAAAYNAGEARIYEYGGIPPFAETVNYVAKVINYQLGLGIPPTRKPKLPQALPRVVDEGASTTGVLPVLKGRKFTGGVMHF